MPGWEDTLPSREPSPEERAIKKEEELSSTPSVSLSSQEEKIIEKTWRDMRRLRPELYVVFKAWVKLFKLRDENTQYSHGVYRGFYAEMSQKLAVTAPAVSHRLKKGMKWFAERLEKNNLKRDAT